MKGDQARLNQKVKQWLIQWRVYVLMFTKWMLTHWYAQSAAHNTHQGSLLSRQALSTCWHCTCMKFFTSLCSLWITIFTEVIDMFTISQLYQPVWGRGNSTVVSVSVYQAGDLGSRPPRSACVTVRKVEFYRCVIHSFPPVPTTG